MCNSKRNKLCPLRASLKRTLLPRRQLPMWVSINTLSKTSILLSGEDKAFQYDAQSHQTFIITQSQMRPSRASIFLPHCGRLHTHRQTKLWCFLAGDAGSISWHKEGREVFILSSYFIRKTQPLPPLTVLALKGTRTTLRVYGLDLGELKKNYSFRWTARNSRDLEGEMGFLYRKSRVFGAQLELEFSS